MEAVEALARKLAELPATITLTWEELIAIAEFILTGPATE